jgi:integrase
MMVDKKKPQTPGLFILTGPNAAKKQLLFDRYASRLVSEGSGRTTYLRMVYDFLNYAEDMDFHDEERTRKKVQGFLKKLERERGYGSGSQRVAFATVRAFYSRNNIIWPFGRGEAPQISEPEMQVPAIHPDLIVEMIQAVKAKGTPRQKAFLALSTTYGLRRAELKELGPTELKLKDKIIYIATKKHGRARSHVIPDAIIPYLAGYDFKPVGISTVFTTWYEIEYMVGIEHSPRAGFHSIRRTVATILGQYFQENEVKIFLRWKKKGQGDMLMSYSSTTFITRTGTTNQVQPAMSDMDSRMFEKNPFLEAWK